MGIAYTQAPEQGKNKPEHVAYWKEAKKFAAKGRIWCVAMSSCDRVCFCDVLKEEWKNISDTPLPDVLSSKTPGVPLQSANTDSTSGSSPPSIPDYSKSAAVQEVFITPSVLKKFPGGKSSPFTSSQSPIKMTQSPQQTSAGSADSTTITETASPCLSSTATVSERSIQ